MPDKNKPAHSPHLQAMIEKNYQPADIEARMAKLAVEQGYGLIVPPDPSTASQRKLIIELAARHRVPAVDRDQHVTGARVA